MVVSCFDDLEVFGSVPYFDFKGSGCGVVCISGDIEMMFYKTYEVVFFGYY